MREVMGDLFDYPADAIVIPINWTTNKNGEAVMGAGVAKQAVARWPSMPRELGRQILAYRNPQFYIDQTPKTETGGPVILGVPTKRHWRDPSDMELIRVAADILPHIAEQAGWEEVVLPRIGCGLGGLSWPDQVRPLLADALDDRFIVVHPEGQ